MKYTETIEWWQRILFPNDPIRDYFEKVFAQIEEKYSYLNRPPDGKAMWTYQHDFLWREDGTFERYTYMVGNAKPMSYHADFCIGDWLWFCVPQHAPVLATIRSIDKGRGIYWVEINMAGRPAIVPVHTNEVNSTTSPWWSKPMNVS